MNKLLATVALPLLGAFLFLSTPIPIKAEEGINYSETVVFDKVNNVGVENVDSWVIAFHDYTRFYYGGNPNDQCYQCTAQCADYSCCPGSHPQCCYAVFAGCRCCPP